MPAGFFQRRYIPETSLDCYISGYCALNLPAPEDTSGDWHGVNVFCGFEPIDNLKDNGLLVDLAGINGFTDTRNIYGDYGVYDCTKELARYGYIHEGGRAYAANHFRAVLDLLFYDLCHGMRYPRQLGGASENYFDNDEQKNFLLDKAREMRPYLNSEGERKLLMWIDNEETGNWWGSEKNLDYWLAMVNE
jgi:hypothetical protein